MKKLIKKFDKGNIFKSEDKLYLDVGDGVIPIYSQKVPGTNSSIEYNGKTYYYNSSAVNNSFTPNSKIQRDRNRGNSNNN